MLSRVDLPQPEWPMMETYSPLSMPTVMSASTWVSCPPPAECFVDVVDLQISHVRRLPSVGRGACAVTTVAIRATRRSSTKPMAPM